MTELNYAGWLMLKLLVRPIAVLLVAFLVLVVVTLQLSKAENWYHRSYPLNGFVLYSDQGNTFEYNLVTEEITLLRDKVSHQVQYVPGTRQISFIEKTEDRQYLKVYDLDSCNTETLLEVEESIASYVWAPDGQSFIYQRGGFPQDSKLYVVKVGDVEQVITVPIEGYILLEDWSVDGQQVLISTSSSASGDVLYIYFLQTGVVERVHADNYILKALWAPDELVIAYRNDYGNGAPYDGSLYFLGSPDPTKIQLGNITNFEWYEPAGIIANDIHFGLSALENGKQTWLNACLSAQSFDLRDVSIIPGWHNYQSGFNCMGIEMQPDEILDFYEWTDVHACMEVD